MANPSLYSSYAGSSRSEEKRWEYVQNYRQEDQVSASPIFTLTHPRSYLFDRELSKGQFSATNHKRLNGHDRGVHIFEAKVMRDLRLVVSAGEGVGERERADFVYFYFPF